MEYIYYSTTCPVTTGTYPDKLGCTPVDYGRETYIPGIPFEVWGHIIYSKPLSQEEVNKYRLLLKPIKMKVEFTLENEQVVSLYKLLQAWKQCKDSYGNHPFKSYNMNKMFSIIMQSGSFHTINKQSDSFLASANIKD